MPNTSPSQRKTEGRVMHEFKHGELKSGPGGKGGKVKSRRQAIAIALKEAGASKYESDSENKKNLSQDQAQGSARRDVSAEIEGKSHVGARGRDSSRGMGRRNAAGAKRTGTRSRRRHAG